jgi:hypothetical protein
MFHAGRFRARSLRAPVPLLALLLGLATLFGAGINFGEAMVGRASAPHSHGRPGTADAGAPRGPGGLAVANQGYVMLARTTRITAGEFTPFRFSILDDQGRPLTDFAQRGDRRMDLIIVRRDMTGYQHLLPTMGPDGTWTVPLELSAPGSYRAFAEFLPVTVSTPITLGVDLQVSGFFEPGPIPKESTVAKVGDYTVVWTGALLSRSVSRVWVHVLHDNLPVTDLDPYLGGGGHLVILREGDLAYLHVRPVGGPRQETSIAFEADVPSAGYYRMFMEFQHRGHLRTAEFTALAR